MASRLLPRLRNAHIGRKSYSASCGRICQRKRETLFRVRAVTVKAKTRVSIRLICAGRMQMGSSIGRTTRTRCSFLARFDLLEHESLHWLVRQTERCRLLNCPIHIPTVHKDPLDEPHPGGSAAACSMNERGFHSRRPHRLQQGVYDAWVGAGCVKRNMNVRDAGNNQRTICSRTPGNTAYQG